MDGANKFGLSIITNRYAKAFIELAEKTDMFDKFNSDLMLAKETFEQNKELKDFIGHPLIQTCDKKEAIDDIFRNHISVYSLNLLKILIDKNRIFILSGLSGHYSNLLDKKRNITVAQVITAIEIDEATKNRVKEKLQSLLNTAIKINSSVNKDIIAGMTIKIGDKIIDGSIKTKLETMKKQLI